MSSMKPMVFRRWRVMEPVVRSCMAGVPGGGTATDDRRRGRARARCPLLSGARASQGISALHHGDVPPAPTRPPLQGPPMKTTLATALVAALLLAACDDPTAPERLSPTWARRTVGPGDPAQL